jgi:spore coat protein A
VKLDRRKFLLAAAAAPLACRRESGGGPAEPAPAPVAPPAPARPAPAAAVRKPLHPETLARFVDPLPIPRRLAPAGLRPDPQDPSRQLPFYRVAMREAAVKVHRDVPPTRFWTYDGSVPGPTIEVESGRAALVEWRNELPARHFLPIDHTLCGAGPELPDVRAVTHVHGAKAPPESDGYPTEWTTPGQAKTFRYPNQQEAAGLWYHDHAMGIERLNQYAGLYGFFLVRDRAEAALRLPSGDSEIPIVLADRMFNADGQLHYPSAETPEAPWVEEVYGDVHLVNGKLFPFLEVGPRRYRLRLLNASNARVLYLALSNGQRFHQIGSDQGLLAAPLPLTSLTLAPAERADVIVDFGAAAGTNVVLKSQALELMQFRVARGPAPRPAALPRALRPIARMPASSAVKTRTLTLNHYVEPKTQRMLMLLNATRWHEPVTEKPELGSVEIWSLVNLTEDTHPVHLHLVRFQILERQRFEADEFNTSGKMVLVGDPIPPGPDEMGWKDTARADPGLITRIIVRFDGYPGRYVWHCHLLEHAANEMMRPFEVVTS